MHTTTRIASIVALASAAGVANASVVNGGFESGSGAAADNWAAIVGGALSPMDL